MSGEAPFKITSLSDLPVVQIDLFPACRISQDLPDLVEQITQAMYSAPDPCYLLVDIRQLKVEWSELLGILVKIRDVRRQGGQKFNYSELLIITTSDVLKLGARALTQQQYSGITAVAVFDTTEEALEHVRARTAAEPGPS